MTVLAYKDGVLAADRRSSFGNAIVTTSKIRRGASGMIAGACGHSMKCRAALAWLLDEGADPSKWPGSSDVQILAITLDGRIWIYDDGGHPIEVFDEFAALGSGIGEANVAMACGKSAVEAVLLAAQFNSTCGNGADYLYLSDIGGPITYKD